MVIIYVEHSNQLDFSVIDEDAGYQLTFYNIEDHYEEIQERVILISKMGLCPYYSHLKLREELLKMFRFRFKKLKS